MKNKLPKLFDTRLKKIYNQKELEIIQNWLNITKRKVNFRINTLKSNEKEIFETLKLNNLTGKKVNFLKNWYILESWKEKDLWDLDIFKQWKIYLQSLSSQIPVDLLDLNDFSKVLDITASPWWKTSQVCSLLSNTWEIIANDNNQIRIDKLNFTLKRQWCKNVKVIKSDARNIAKNNPQFIWYFDCIIADLPCSAEWKINLNNEKSYSYWNEKIFKKNYKLQKQILQSIIPLLKNWWTLIYSTCTLSPEENEAIVHMILSNYPEFKIDKIKFNYKYSKPWILKFWKQCFRKDTNKSIRIFPSEESEGFFIAKFKKVSI